ncbi:tannase/feruloyl esterase family alpha/beta hydrolase [Bradyrhizobium huanghuaihaiense]|uniref:tannase/feruloyl esterase family alpha/beta hydrolase n=1 Tax=Bradyrhizobium huanghuaihaiense TaxID=990078 RepID=UPI0021A9DFA4|nr:tannase/feruloyl esterase family alpha/beta hydrolase [Bradyrhizobium sp. CB3035]UWU76302.1 tannase/feruloyl esterase family alpha/beta hydrolase [Bradyrhizobium sp. CB3035]
MLRVSARRRLHRQFWLCAALALIGAIVSAGTAAAGSDSDSFSPVTACDRLQSETGPAMRISEAQPRPSAGGLPAHCEVIAYLDERTGVDGQKFAIGLHLRLPEAWNGRFVFQGQGGTDGVLGNGDALPGGGQPSALNQGYATVTTDAGHSNAPGPLGGASFGLDPQARIDFGYRADDVVTRRARQFIQAYYGRLPTYSYFLGCSNGGRHGMVLTQRFPEHFDGVAAGAPAFRMPEKGLAGAASTQGFAAIAPKAPDGRPILAEALSRADMELLSKAVVQSCDEADGLADGIIDNVPACRFSPRTLQCPAEKTASCLSGAQVAALENYFEGPTTAQGRRIYAPYPYDSGIATEGWRRWILGTAPDSRVNAFNVSFGATLAYLYMTPPHSPLASEAEAVYDFYRTVDVTAAHAGIFGTSAAMPESSVQTISANSVDLSAFRQRRGKLLLYHGVSDPTFSALDTLDWYKRLANAAGGEKETAKFARLFLVPGMNHCSGGPATDSFDVLTPLVAWVEQGRAPERIEARAGATTPWPGRSRPLCPYSRQARYLGSGSIETAESFVCTAP